MNPWLEKSNGYMRILYEGKKIQYHRLVWFKFYGEWPDGQIDHIDHDRANNNIDNLRVVSHRENALNQSMNSNNTSGFTGVYWDKIGSKWESSIRLNGKKKQLYWGGCLLDAVAARMAANKKYGFHENHGIKLGKIK